jgi:TRAP-type C4-dicarboxylate transport system permease small subunit
MMTKGSGPGLIAVLDLFVHKMTRVADQLSALACAILIVVTAAAMVIYQLGVTTVGLDDILRMLLIWLIYLGTVSLCLHGDHISMDAVYQILPARVRRVFDLVTALIGFGLCAFVTKIGLDSLQRDIAYQMLLPSGYLPSWPQSLAIPLCFALMTVAYLSYLLSVISGRRHREISEAEQLAEGL